MAMLRVHLLQNWFGYSDPAMEEALYETTILRQFAGLNPSASPTKPPFVGADGKLTHPAD